MVQRVTAGISDVIPGVGNGRTGVEVNWEWCMYRCFVLLTKLVLVIGK